MALRYIFKKDYATHLGISDKSFMKQRAQASKSVDETISTSDAILQMNIPNNENLDKLKTNFSRCFGSL